MNTGEVSNLGWFSVKWWALLAGCFALLAPQAALADGAPAGSAAPAGEQLPWQEGPKHFDLGHEVTLDISERYAFLERAPAAKLLEKNGNIYNDNLLGVVVGTAAEEDWFAVLRYDEEGYIKDDEAIDAKELLESIREGQNEANAERKQRGFEALNIDGWQEPPHYDKALHHLVWGLNVSSAKNGTSVNYSTRILGRRGYVSLNLVTDPVKLNVDKPHAAALLKMTQFKGGSRYQDFNESSDKVAEYGLGGLVLAGAGVGAAKLVKVGLLAKFGKILIGLLIAGKKFVVVGLLALAALVKALFKRKPALPDGAPPQEG